MGEIVRARIDSRHRVLLIGQAPGSEGDTRPLTGTMGLRLAELAGLPKVNPRGYEMVPRDEAIGLYFDRANVLDFYPGRDGKGHAFPIGHARVAAEQMLLRARDDYDRVLFCSRAVFEAFRTCGTGEAAARRRKLWRGWPMLEWHDGLRVGGTQLAAEWAWMPHTSLVVRWWNDPANVERASAFLTDLVAWTRGRTLRAA